MGAGHYDQPRQLHQIHLFRFLIGLDVTLNGHSAMQRRVAHHRALNNRVSLSDCADSERSTGSSAHLTSRPRSNSVTHEVLPSFHTAPVVRCAPAMTASNDCSIHSQSSSEMVIEGNSLIVWLPWPATCVSSLWSSNKRDHDQLAEQPAARGFEQIPRGSESRRARRPKFNADHQPFTTNRSNQFVAAGHLLKPAQQPYAKLCRFFDQSFGFDHFQGCESRRHGEIVF